MKILHAIDCLRGWEQFHRCVFQTSFLTFIFKRICSVGLAAVQLLLSTSGRGFSVSKSNMDTKKAVIMFCSSFANFIPKHGCRPAPHPMYGLGVVFLSSCLGGRKRSGSKSSGFCHISGSRCCTPKWWTRKLPGCTYLLSPIGTALFDVFLLKAVPCSCKRMDSRKQSSFRTKSFSQACIGSWESLSRSGTPGSGLYLLVVSTTSLRIRANQAGSLAR